MPPLTSARSRFILPSSSPKTRKPMIFSTIQDSCASVSAGAKPASTRKPAPIFPVTRPSTRTSARETRWSTTLTAPPRPKPAPRLDGRALHSALRIPLSAFDSLYRHALGQIARLIHVTSAAHRDVVGEELERQHREHGR